jgi:hypothetical protein
MPFERGRQYRRIAKRSVFVGYRSGEHRSRLLLQQLEHLDADILF